MADVLDQLGMPAAVTLSRIKSQASGDFGVWINDRKNRRQIPYRLERCGYVAVRNDAAKDGLWKVHDARQAIYAKSTLSIADRCKAARRLIPER